MENKKLEFAFRTKKDGESEEVIIEGFANRASIKGEKVVDRGNEHIPKEEWKIEEWLKNPIIFLNHDRDIPIGKGLDAKVTDEGLWIKVQISKSEAPAIKMARDLIKEGILQTFSVGIDVEAEEIAEDKSITLKGVNLLETSVVSIPMNQESFFSISKKCLEDKPLDIIESEILASRGKHVAAKVHEKLYSFCLKEEVERDTVIENLKNYSEDMALLLKGELLEGAEDLFEVLATNLDFEEIELEKAFEEETSEGEDEEDKAFGEEEDEELEDEEEKSGHSEDEDEDEEEKAEEDSEDSEEDESENEKSEQGIDISQTTDEIKENMGQPMLIALQQMNTFMGQLIAETQKTHKLLEGIVPPKVDVEEDSELEFTSEEEEEEEAKLEEDEAGEEGDDEELAEDSEEEEDEELDDMDEEKYLEISKSLDIIGSYSEKLNKSLSRFNL